MRPPSPDIRGWDSMASETACSGQLLYIYHQLELCDLRSLDRAVRRVPGRRDLHHGNLRLLLEAGFQVHEISPEDPKQLVGPNGREYLATLWQAEGDSKRATNRYLSFAYPTRQASARHKLEIVGKFPDQYEHTLRDAKPDDVRRLVDEGWHVCYETPSDSGLYILVIQKTSTNCYEVFSPSNGMHFVDDEAFAKHPPSSLRAYRYG